MATSSQRATQSGITDPLYVRPSYPLSREAQFALQELLNSRSLGVLEKHLTQANDLLTESAGEINDRLHESRTRLNKQRERLEARGPDGPRRVQEREAQLGEMRDRVEQMTETMEEQVRKIIDAQQGLDGIKKSVEAAHRECGRFQAPPPRSQMRASQRQRTPVVAGDEGADGDAQMADADDAGEPHDGAPAAQGFPVASEIFRSQIEAAKTEYQSLSLGTRYANHHAYIGFRRLVHDSQHPDEDAPSLPHPDMWFPEGEVPEPGITLVSQAATGAAEEDSDEDLAVSRATISTKCPLTLQEFRNPATSTKCPHTFEREAIIGMIQRSTLRVGMSESQPRGRRGGARGSGERYVRCPVGGCTEHITESDLYADPLLIRKIQRIQRARADADDDDDDVGLPKVGETFEEVADDADVAAVGQRKLRRGTTVPPKAEPRSSGVAPPSSAASGRGSGVTHIVDLESDSDEG